jgi:hypothetical protein
MLQGRLIFSNESVMASPGKTPKRGWTSKFQTAQLRVGVVAILSLLAFAVIADRPNSGYPTMQLLLTFNAVVLGYLSAFWGLWTEPTTGEPGGLPFSSRRIALAERDRLLWSIAPTFLGGCGMLLPLILPQDIGLLMLVTGFTLLVALEALGQRRGVPAAEFKRLRWTICMAAMAILLDVLVNQRWAVRILF